MIKKDDIFVKGLHFCPPAYYLCFLNPDFISMKKEEL